MKTMKIGIILLSFMLAAMIMAPMVSAGDQSDSPVMENTLVNQNISNGEQTTDGPLPYANIAVYGPSSTQTYQPISLYTSGEIGNIINIYPAFRTNKIKSRNNKLK